MPFLAPIAAPLIGAAGSVIGGLIGGRKSNLEKQIANLITPSLNNLTNFAGQANAAAPGLEGRRDYYSGVSDEYTGRARGYEPMAREDIGRASQFYNRLLSPGTVDAVNAILGKARGGVMKSYDALKQTAGRTGSRGGGRTAAMMDFDFAKNRDLLELIPQARVMAAQGLLQTGGAAGQQAGRLNQTSQGYGQLGLGFGQQALGYRTLAGDLSKGVLNFASGQPQKENTGGLLGGYIGDLIGSLPIFNKKKGNANGLPDDYSMD